MKNAIKVTLFASLIVAMVLPFSGMNFAEAKESNDTRNYDKLSKQLDREIERFVSGSEKFSTDKVDELNQKFTDKKSNLIAEYSNLLKNNLDQVLGDGFNDLSVDEQAEMIEYIINEKFKEPIQNKFESDMIVEKDGISIMGFEIIPPVYAACSTQPNVYKFKQVRVDINGIYPLMEGDNELQSVQRNNLSSCLREYTLTFADEDHPVSYIDANYDIYRLYEYGRIQDVEKFYVSNGNIWFLDSGSKSQGYLTFYPIHYQEIDSFSNTVYVSNTWNHLMDTSNTNPGDSMKTWYK